MMLASQNLQIFLEGCAKAGEGSGFTGSKIVQTIFLKTFKCF